MPRRSSFSGRSSSPRSQATHAPPPRAAAPPVQHNSAPLVQAPPRSGGFLSNMAGTFATGMALGAGSEVAHQAIRGVMGGNSHQAQAPAEQTQTAPVETQQQTKFQSCDFENQSFIQCLQRNAEISFCQHYADALKECQKKYN